MTQTTFEGLWEEVSTHAAELAGRRVRVTVLDDESPQIPDQTETEKRGWPAGFFDSVIGTCADDPIERPEQGEYEIREELQ
ncbi:MAG: hypothetical protein AB4038_09860 [Prochloraceae cyanobacterium]